MRKAKVLAIVLILTMVLAACGLGKEQQRTFNLKESGIDTTLVYTYKGDKVSKQTTESSIDYSTIGVQSEQEARQLLDPIFGLFQGIEGLTHSVKYTDTNLTEYLIVDFNKVDIDEIKNLPGMSFSDDAKKGISMKQSAELITNQGFVEVK